MRIMIMIMIILTRKCMRVIMEIVSLIMMMGNFVMLLKQNASEYGPTFLGIITTLILVYVNLPSNISSIFCSLCHTQCDLFDSRVREHQEKRLCMLMSLNMPLEPGKRRGRRGGGKKKEKKNVDMYITTFFFLPPPPPPHPTSRRIPI